MQRKMPQATRIKKAEVRPLKNELQPKSDLGTWPDCDEWSRCETDEDRACTALAVLIQVNA